MKSQVQKMAQTALSDLLDSPNIYSNWSTTHSPIYITDGSNNTSPTASPPGDEIDDLRYSMSTTVILM